MNAHTRRPGPTAATPFTPTTDALPGVPVAARRRATRLVKHPLLASALATGDSRFDFEAFAAAMLGDLDPQGPLESTLAARAVGLAWRLNRAQGLETYFLSRPSRHGSRETPLASGFSSRFDLATVEGLQRWETSLERSLARTLEMLERVRVANRRSTTTDHGSNRSARARADAGSGNRGRLGPKQTEIPRLQLTGRVRLRLCSVTLTNSRGPTDLSADRWRPREAYACRRPALSRTPAPSAAATRWGRLVADRSQAKVETSKLTARRTAIPANPAGCIKA
jgi:hypothetical protein